MTEDELLKVIRQGIDRVAALDPQDREPALRNLRASAEQIALQLRFSRSDARRFADELALVLRSSVSTANAKLDRRVLH